MSSVLIHFHDQRNKVILLNERESINFFEKVNLMKIVETLDRLNIVWTFSSKD